MVLIIVITIYSRTITSLSNSLHYNHTFKRVHVYIDTRVRLGPGLKWSFCGLLSNML
jgi:hypothetical protein